MGVSSTASAEQLIETCDIVVGATGERAIGTRDVLRLRDGAVLASASSGDVEFVSLADWPMFQMPLLPGGSALSEFDRIHGLLTARGPCGQSVHIVNGGFPVNFTGEVDPIRLDYIIPTRGLMLGAYLQAVQVASSMAREEASSGVVPLRWDLDMYVRSFAPVHVG